MTGLTALSWVGAAPQVTAEVETHLKEAGVTVKKYETLLSDIKRLGASGVRIWADPNKVSLSVLLPLCLWAQASGWPEA